VSDDLPASRIALIATGGTIASMAAGDGSLVAVLSAADLLARAAPPESIRVEPVHELVRVNSWDVQPSLMWRLAAQVEALLAEPDIAGVVVTHGTDTIEETAFVLELGVGSDKPVVLTAALRSADELSADGPRNLRQACMAAASRSARGLGVVVCLDGELHTARWVRKVHSYQVHALQSPGHGPVGAFTPSGELRVSVSALPRSVVEWPVDPAANPVPVVSAYTGFEPDTLMAVAERTGARGLVIDGFGLGNVPGPAVAAIRGLRREGVVVAVATRVVGGGAFPVYGGEGGGAQLVREGVLSAGELSAAKARLLLMACLSGADASLAGRRFTDAVDVLGGAK
jgi:L-asparaginase